MYYKNNEDYHSATRITGPTHNYLRLRFDKRKTHNSGLEIVRLSDFKESKIIERDLRLQVLEGVRDANLYFNTNFQVTEIGYLQDDSPSKSAYKILAYFIVQKMME